MSVHWKIWLFFAVFFPLTVALGFWQLDRSEQKLVLEEQLKRVHQMPAVDLIDIKQVQGLPGQAFRLSGELSPELFLLDNRTHGGRVGYEVIQWLHTTVGLDVLLNRGWVPAPRYRSELPELGWPESVQDLEGYFYRSSNQTPVLDHQANEQVLSATYRASEAAGKGMGTGKPVSIIRIQSLDWSKLLSNQSLVPAEFRPAHERPELTYALGWKETGIGSQKHFGYAIQWFSMAFTLLLLCGVTSYRLARRSDSLRHHEERADGSECDGSECPAEERP